MADQSDSEDGILDLWPTKFLRRRIEDFESWNKDLIKLVRELEKNEKALARKNREKPYTFVNGMAKTLDGFERKASPPFASLPMNWTAGGSIG